MQLSVYVRPDQAEALSDLARRESEARGLLRPDVSGVLRRVLDKALRLKPPG